MIEGAFLLTSFVALFVTIDPVGTAPLVPALTAGMSPRRKRAVVLRAVAVGAIVLGLFGIAGEAALEVIGVSLPAFRIAGGLLLFLIAVEMLFEKRTERREGKAEAAREDPSVFPLAIPFLAGPGAIATMILLVGEAESVAQIVAVHLVMLAVLLVALVFFLAAAGIERLLGAIGISVVTRLLGMLVAAIAVEFVLSGLRDLGVPLG